jgi:hypothetical protein
MHPPLDRNRSSARNRSSTFPKPNTARTCSAPQLPSWHSVVVPAGDSDTAKVSIAKEW